MASKETTLKELYAAQSVTMGLIGRAVENFNKVAKVQRDAAMTSSRLNNLRGDWEKCVQQHKQIISLADKDAATKDEYFINDLFASMSCIFEEACDYFSKLSAKFNPPPIAQSSFDESHTTNSNSVANSIKLPQISLPSFSGDLQEWENYRDLFLALVDQNATLVGVQKLHYLKSSLSGEVSLVLKNIAVTEANYTTAWELMRRRFDNTRLIVYSYLRALTEIPNIRCPSNKDLRNLRDKANDIRQALINLGRPMESWEDLFNFLVISKLDRESLSDWELKLGGSTALPSFADLGEFLTSRIRAFDAVDSVGQTVQADEYRYKNRKSDKRINLVSHHVGSTEAKCAFCEANHTIATCNKFKKKHISERRAFLFENHLCFLCLKPGHVTATCLSKSACTVCKGKHHTLVHFKNTRTNVSSGKSADAQSKVAEIDSPSTSVQDEKNQFTACHATYPSVNKVLLPSARVKITADNGRTIIVRALLDQGSQVTCVTERVAEFLKPKRIPVSVDLAGIGGKNAGRVKCAVNLEMSSCNHDDNVEGCGIKFTALVLKNLTSYTSSSFEYNPNWKHLVDLPLADSHPSKIKSFDLLIGAGDYGKVVLEGTVKGPLGSPIAQRTIFGWVLCGSCGEPNGTPRSDMQVHHVEILDELHKDRRQPDGRYEVRLPFVMDPTATIGDSATIARKIQ